MFGKFSHIFARNTKKRKSVEKVRKNYFSFESKTPKIFKKRKKKLTFTPYLGGRKKFLILFGLAILLIGLGVLNPIFKINEIYIFRQNPIINIDQAYGNIDYMRGKNILLLNTSEIASRLQKSQKSISDIAFDIDLPNKVNITIGSHPALFQTQEYLILSNGVVVSKESKQYAGIPFIETSENIENYAIFGNILNISNLRSLDTLIKQGKRNILGLNFDKVKYYITEKEVLIMHSSGSIFIFDLTANIPEQIEKLAIYEKEKGNIYEERYVYIDLRIQEKLFLCPLSSEFNCKNSIKFIYGDTIFEEFAEESSELIQ